MKVYFAGSIRGGRVDANLYERLIKYIQKTDVVLTEHVGNLNLSEEGQTVTDIYNQDTNWLRESDVLIAECTCPSLGVGYELAYAERFQKPCHILAQPTNPVECVQSLTQKHVAKRYMIGEKFLPLRHES